MIKVMEAVVSNSIDANKAATVPPMMRLFGQVKHGTKQWPQSYLTPTEENELAEFLVKACKMGNGKTKQKLYKV